MDYELLFIVVYFMNYEVVIWRLDLYFEVRLYIFYSERKKLKVMFDPKIFSSFHFRKKCDPILKNDLAGNGQG